jgi:hypothetical protein
VIVIVDNVDRPKTCIVINSLLSPIMFNKPFSPLLKVPTSVLSFTYNSNADFSLIVFCATLSTIAYAPDVDPVNFLFSNDA